MQTLKSIDITIHYNLLAPSENHHKLPESKFLVKSLPENLEKFSNEEICQGFVLNSKREQIIRVRRKGERYFFVFTDKRKDDEEREINRASFDSLWDRAANKVEKRRYYIRHKENVIELDVYKGNLKGLVIASVKFPHKDERKHFKQPDWFEKDVSKDKRYRAVTLAVNGIPKNTQLFEILRK